MEARAVDVNDVVQIDPQWDKRYGGAFLQVVDTYEKGDKDKGTYESGVRGNVKMAGSLDPIFLEVPFESVEPVGKAAFVPSE